MLTVHGGIVSHVFWNIGNFEVFWQAGVIPNVGFLRQQVDHANELVFGADWQNHNQWVGGQDVFHLINNAVEVSAQAVQLVYEDDTSNFGFVRIAPVGFGLRLNATGTTEYANAAIQYFQGAVYFNGEINVSRGVNNVQAVLVPLTSNSSRLNGNTTLSFLFHEVSSRFAIVYFTGLVDLAGELQDTLSGGGLTGINVGEDTNVSVFG